MIKNFLFKTQFEPSKYPLLYGIRNSNELVLRLGLDNKLQVHNGCINTISWSDDDCNLIVSGSDDLNISITDAFSGQNKTTIKTNHRANIFCTKFMPNSNSEKIVSCAADGSIYLTDLNESTFFNNQSRFDCHGDKACYKICNYIQDNKSFATCGQDGCVKVFDLRVSSRCKKMFCNEHTLIKLSTGISALAINPMIPYHIVCAGLDGIVRFYDRRAISVGSDSQSTNGMFASFGEVNNTSMSSNNQNAGGTVVSSKRVTSLQFDNWGNDLLVSYQSDNIYLLDWRDLSLENKKCSSDMNDIDNHEEADNTEVRKLGQGIELPSSKGRKFRISTDWSDTGPQSVPTNESLDNNDPRSFLLRRLNDWFSDFYQNRPRTSDQSNIRNLAFQSEQGTSSTLNTTAATSEKSFNNLDKNNEKMDFEEEKNTDKRDSNDSGEEFSNNNREDDMNTNKSQKNNLTSYLIGSRIKMRQALKVENNIIKNKPSPRIKKVYTGHRNARTMIKECNFWGQDHVISGSDCGHIFIWDRKKGTIVNIIEADKHVVNCVQENPLYPVLASSGIDYDIKIFQPILQEFETNLDSKIEMLTKRNKMMLNEIKNTIFIPVQFMVPALRLFGANMRNNTRNISSNRNRNINDQNQNAE